MTSDGLMSDGMTSYDVMSDGDPDSSVLIVACLK